MRAIHLILPAVFTALVLLGIWSDVRQRRVSNKLNIVLLGIAAACAARGGSALAEAAVSALLAACIWLIPWWIGIVGAGDVKYAAASAAALPPNAVLWTMLIAAVLGGVQASVVVLSRGVATATSGTKRNGAGDAMGGHPLGLRNFMSGTSIPYTLPIGVAVLLSFWFPRSRMLVWP